MNLLLIRTGNGQHQLPAQFKGTAKDSRVFFNLPSLVDTTDEEFIGVLNTNWKYTI
jgi:hypothetical protein